MRASERDASADAGARDGREQTRAPAAPSHAAAPVPDPRAVAARDRWLEALRTLSPTSCIADATVDAIAADVGVEAFCFGVEKHLEAEPRWWQQSPLRALRTRCGWWAKPGTASAGTVTPPAPPAPARIARTLAVKCDHKLLVAYALGTASAEQRAIVEASPLYVRDVGEERGYERPFAEWPAAIREEALEHLRVAERNRRVALAGAGGAP